jgi:multidrug efflux pump subunit AcrB
MIRLVKIALEKPYTFAVMAIFILLFGTLTIFRSAIDIFPDIKIPVISVVWSYTGMSPKDMSGRVIYAYERSLSSTVNDIEHIESQSLPGFGIVKIYFQPNVDIRTATAQVTSISQTVLKQMPPGITPPVILNYNASTVPIIQLALSSLYLPEQKIFDIGQNFIRPSLASVPGSTVPSPYGGKTRQIQIDLNPEAMLAKHISPDDVNRALTEQNQIIPVGTIKINQYEYTVKLNNSPEDFNEINLIPIKTVNGSIVTIGDIGHVRDGFPPQTNIVRVNGQRAVLMSILKNGQASSLAVIKGVIELIPQLKDSLPKSLQIQAVGDQSIFVKAAVSGVMHEGVIAALLTSLMILLFLGSWRSTVIISTSIPLAILCAIIAISVTGESLNVMTLGGLALAVGILVDDATVTIENINWHLEQGKSVQEAILDGASQIVTPAFVSLLCICIVFVPMLFLSGVSKFLFVPLAKSVVFAMIASFVLSRTFIPTAANFLLKPFHTHLTHTRDDEEDINTEIPQANQNPFMRFQKKFDSSFENIREKYLNTIQSVISHRKAFITSTLGFVLLSFSLILLIGQDFFPSVDAGQIKLHARLPVGTRVEVTAAKFDDIERTIRSTIPKDELESIVDNIGMTVSNINQAYNNTGTIGPQDGDILITLKHVHHPTNRYIKTMREMLPKKYPEISFAFLPADIVSQILNFGAPSPIDIQIAGSDEQKNNVFMSSLLSDIKRIPGIVDTRVQQASYAPEIRVNVDRLRAKTLGVTEKNITDSLVSTLAGTSQISPAFWLNPKNGVSYPIVAQTPQYELDTLTQLANVSIASENNLKDQILGGLATVERGSDPAVISHYAVTPSLDIYASVQDRDLGSVTADLEKVLDSHQNQLPKGSKLNLRGQSQSMKKSFAELGWGLLGAIILVYLVLVVNFQSWKDPFVIVTALPAALAGIVWILFLSGTSICVPALTGAIMCMGVATANSVLVVSFAKDKLKITGDPIQAAIEAGYYRFRPVLMTALAMILGMLPMALGLGEGGEQNAPLGRAVIGGLIFATPITLLFVPAVFSFVHKNHQLQQDNAI